MENKVIICECNSSEHMIRFVYDEDDKELYMDVHLSNYQNIFQRIWVAIKYVLGYRSKYGNWDSVILGKKQVDELSYIILKYRNGQLTSQLPSVHN